MTEAKQHTMQHSQTMATQSNQKTQNMSTSLKYNNYILIICLIKVNQVL